MKIIAGLTVVLLLLVAGCTSQKSSPDELREKTAQATSEIKNNAKALADGVKEGWNRNQPLDVNNASKEQLSSLPGMSPEGAERIIDGDRIAAPPNWSAAASSRSKNMTRSRIK